MLGALDRKRTQHTEAVTHRGGALALVLIRTRPLRIVENDLREHAPAGERPACQIERIAPGVALQGGGHFQDSAGNRAVPRSGTLDMQCHLPRDVTESIVAFRLQDHALLTARPPFLLSIGELDPCKLFG